MERFASVKKTDHGLYALVKKELQRQSETIDLIASENCAPPEVLELLGSELTNKYSEGYPGKRYYAGNEQYDAIETLAQTRAVKAFELNAKTWAVNVQPYSGSPANMEVYMALLQPGDTILAMGLASGGHLTHGHKASASGKLYNAVHYGVDPKTGLIDYKEVEALAKKHSPKLVVSGASAYPRKIDFKKIGEIAKGVGAYHMADISHIAGLVAVKEHPSPFPYADVVTTTTHKTLQGPRGAVIFANRASAVAQRKGIDIESAINSAVFPGMQGGPHNNNIAAIATMFLRMQKPAFAKQQRQVVANAKALSDALKKLGYAIVTGGTDNHLMLVDLKSKAINGTDAERKLEEVGIIVNRNTIAGDTSPMRPSGMRLGTPYATAIGMKEREMKIIAGLINRAVTGKEKPATIKKEVRMLRKKFRS